PGHARDVRSLAFSPDGKRLASAGDDGVIKIWDVDTGKEIRPLRGLADAVCCVAFGPVLTKLPAVYVPGHTDAVRCVVFSPDGKLRASAGADKPVRLWSAATGTELFAFTGHTRAVNGVAFNGAGDLLASGGHDDTVRLWDVPGRKEKTVLKGHRGEV